MSRYRPTKQLFTKSHLDYRFYLLPVYFTLPATILTARGHFSTSYHLTQPEKACSYTPIWDERSQKSTLSGRWLVGCVQRRPITIHSSGLGSDLRWILITTILRYRPEISLRRVTLFTSPPPAPGSRRRDFLTVEASHGQKRFTDGRVCLCALNKSRPDGLTLRSS